MINLTEQNIEFITNIINESNIESIELKEDLIDHFCCTIEEEMNKGLSFDKSYDKAYMNICPDGFDEIQRETVFLLTAKKINAMKRLMYFSGYLTAIGTTTSIFLKLNHIAGGQTALIATGFILVFLFLPVLIINQYRRESTKSLGIKLKYLSGFSGLILLIAFIVFKTSHWPGSAMIFLISIVLLNFVFFPLLFYKMYRKTV